MARQKKDAPQAEAVKERNVKSIFFEDKEREVIDDIIDRVGNGERVIGIFNDFRDTDNERKRKIADLNEKYAYALTTRGKQYGMDRRNFTKILDKYPDLRREYDNVGADKIQTNIDNLSEELRAFSMKTPTQSVEEYLEIYATIKERVMSDDRARVADGIYKTHTFTKVQSLRGLLELYRMQAELNPVLNSTRVEGVEIAKIKAQNSMRAEEGNQYLTEVDSDVVPTGTTFEERCEEATRNSIEDIKDLAKEKANWSDEQINEISNKFEVPKRKDD